MLAVGALEQPHVCRGEREREEVEKNEEGPLFSKDGQGEDCSGDPQREEREGGASPPSVVDPGDGVGVGRRWYRGAVGRVAHVVAL
jgi:hypothetical protein